MTKPIYEYGMIENIIKEDLIEIYFQPLVSIRSKKIYAFEALTRCPSLNIAPTELFKMAKEKNLLFQLEIMTRIKAIEKFHQNYLEDNELMLFLNFESSFIDKFNVKNNEYGFAQKIEELNMPSENFMLEIKEDEISNSEALVNFCLFYKDLGFSIALDDFGTGNSNFNRINIIKPDLIKIDKSLFIDMKNNQVNKEIVGSISKMCQNIGIHVMAEGVEDEESIYIGMRKGIDFFQGYYFSKAVNILDVTQREKILLKIVSIGSNFRTNIIKGVKQKRKSVEHYSSIAESIIQKITSIKTSYDILKEEYQRHFNIEAIYLIDAKNSKQIHDTVINIKKNIRLQPNVHGDEHYFKEYYYLTLETKKGVFLSQKYISFASGNICKTFAKKFDKEEESYILCLDITL